MFILFEVFMAYNGSMNFLGDFMFVSSYTTYINPSVSEKNTKERLEQNKESFTNFNAKTSLFDADTSKALLSITKKLPLDYISEYKVMHNQQKLHFEPKPLAEEKSKFTKMFTLQSAQEAYIQNSTLFVTSRKQGASLQMRHSEELEGAHKDVLKRKMINTYIQNDQYYKLTA